MALPKYKAISRYLQGDLAVEREAHSFRMVIDEPPSMGTVPAGYQEARFKTHVFMTEVPQ
jgi:hypothetical protein